MQLLFATQTQFVICDCTIEDYHQGLKTGCSIELRQLQSYEALRRLLGLLAPTAVRLLQLRAVARETPERLASEILPTDLVQVVALLAKVPAAALTAQQCWYAIARCGGYLRRRSSGPPGLENLVERLVLCPDSARR